jgi:uncharacterized membrane protein YkvA (DUF1232 family)
MNIQTTLDNILAGARFFGRELTERALTLVYAFLDERTPAWARATILAALAYLLSPIDACPDPIPVAGLADDLAALLGAIATIGGAITSDHIARARQTAADLFG